MARIVVGDIYSKICGDPKALAVVRDVCRARPNGYMYMPKYRAGYWDGYISVMSGMNAFPTGLLDYVVSVLVERGHVVDAPHKFPYVPTVPVHSAMLHGVTLRDYQMAAITSLLDAGRGVAKMATNAGKTEVMAALLKVYDSKAVVVVHRKELMYQTAGRFTERLGISHVDDVGIIGDGVYRPSRITVAMVQTLYSRPELLAVFDGNVVLMADECHHVSSDQMLSVLGRIPGPHRFGFSGTPLKYAKLADMRLIGATGSVVVDVTNADLINGGYSAVPRVVLHAVESDNGWGDDYHTAYSNMISNEQRNTIIANVAIEHKDGLVLILVTRIEHGESLCAAIPGSTFVHGSCSTEYRQGVLETMRQDGAAGTVIATQIFDEGVDIPGVDVIILAGGSKSHIKLLQRIGRGLRRKSGRNEVVIHDFIDDTNKYLLSHSEARVKVYDEEGFETIISR